MQPQPEVSDTVKQHYIPRFILRHFAQGKKKKERLWTFNKYTQRAFYGNIGDAAHENRFYDATNLDGHTIAGEPLLKLLDSAASKAISNVISSGRLSFGPKEGTDISYFVAAQMLRVPTVRNEMEAVRLALIKKWGPEIRAGDDDRPISQYGPADAKHSSIESLMNVPEFAKLFREKVWFLLRAPLGQHFIISDNPVVRHNHYNYWPRGSLGLNQKGIEVYLPLTTQLSLYFVCPEIAEKLRFSKLGHLYLQAQNSGLPVVADADNVEFVNSLQVLFSERFLFARSEQDFRIVRDMLDKDPGLARPASSRLMDEKKPPAGWNLASTAK